MRRSYREPKVLDTGLTLKLRALALTLGLILTAVSAPGQQEDACAEFRQAVKATYNFKPSSLSEAQRDAKSTAMDRFWEMVKAKPVQLLPCLRAAIADPQSDPWFRFDGSNLLVSLDASTAAKAEQVRQYTAANLDDIDQRVWVSALAQRGAEGFDVSEAGTRWLTYPKAEYYLPEHGATKIDSFLGAFFIFGSMDETQATPALLKIASDAKHPAREQALAILLFQATPEAFQALKVANKVGRSHEAQAALLMLLENPQRVEPRAKPKTSREEFLKAFTAYVNGDGQLFAALIRKVPDGERDVVAVLQPEDVPLVRKVRRKMIANANQHAFEFYKDFTKILMTLVWRPDMVN
jgi:hypothetical protein